MSSEKKNYFLNDARIEFSPNIIITSGIIELKLENVLEILHLSGLNWKYLIIFDRKFNIRSLCALCCDFIQINTV
eukprot:gene5555-9373_t